MNTSLVGYTGFVGSNLVKKFKFTNLYNSKNIEEAFGTQPDLLVYSGVRAEKFLANKEPEKDFMLIQDAFNNINKINAKKLVLISTIDVYKNPYNVDEKTEIETENLQAYGLNRYHLEQWVKEEFDTTIIRLPGLFGINIKKNFIYDLIYFIPSMLKEDKYHELCKKDSFIKDYYFLQESGFYKCIDLKRDERIFLKKYFEKAGFSALNFTDSRGAFQFYNLSYLWDHIGIALNNNINLLNLATEPVTIEEIYKHIYNKRFVNEITNNIPNYNYKTKYDIVFKGDNGYIFKKDRVLEDIKQFVEEYTI